MFSSKVKTVLGILEMPESYFAVFVRYANPDLMVFLLVSMAIEVIGSPDPEVAEEDLNNLANDLVSCQGLLKAVMGLSPEDLARLKAAML